MNLENEILNEANFTYKLNIGTFYFFDNFIISEINQECNVNIDNLLEFIYYFNKHYGENNPVGLIANRKNNYSINLIETEEFKNIFKNLVAYAIVYYSEITKKHIDFERKFYDFNYCAFSTLNNAVKWMKFQMEYNMYKEAKTVTINEYRLL